MQVYTSISKYHSTQATVVTLGTFDGLHQGHQTILNCVKQEAQRLQADSLVLTFFPHPRWVLQKDSQVLLLNTLDEKISLFNQMEINHLVVQEFNQEFADLSAEDFVKKVLVDTFHVKKIIIGYDHKFGKGAQANIKDMEQFAQKYGFEVQQISAHQINENAISSTKIRTALKSGDISLANNYLGMPYFISGKVIHGQKLGRTIGFPTANIEISEKYKFIPADGVYVVCSEISHRKIYGIMNIGNKPTVGTHSKSIEVHFLDFAEDLYHKNLKIQFFKRLRNQKKFASIDELKQAIEQDKKFAEQFIEHIAFKVV